LGGAQGEGVVKLKYQYLCPVVMGRWTLHRWGRRTVVLVLSTHAYHIQDEVYQSGPEHIINRR
jgi:hypothetical protein